MTTLIKVRVKTGARKESVETIAPHTLCIAVKEDPERNMANARIVELLALHFDVPTKHIRIIKGHHSPSKTYSIDI